MLLLLLLRGDEPDPDLDAALPFCDFEAFRGDVTPDSVANLAVRAGLVREGCALMCIFCATFCVMCSRASDSMPCGVSAVGGVSGLE